MQGNVVQGRIHWSESNQAVPRLLSSVQAGVISGIAMLALPVLETLGKLMWPGLADAFLWSRINPLIPPGGNTLTAWNKALREPDGVN